MKNDVSKFGLVEKPASTQAASWLNSGRTTPIEVGDIFFNGGRSGPQRSGWKKLVELDSAILERSWMILGYH